MPDIVSLIQQGSSNLFIFIPIAILLGGLHGLEPGHSKTMMAAFIVAIRGTASQAVLLGLSATLSHTLVVWIVAMVGMYFGGKMDAEATEPYFQIASAVLMIGIAVWMIIRTWKAKSNYSETHDHKHDETRIIDTGHGLLKLEIFEDGIPPHFRIHSESAHALEHYSPKNITLEIERRDGSIQKFTFVQKGKFMQSAQEIPEPHEFMVRLKLAHGDHAHDYDLEFTEHHHRHAIPQMSGLDLVAPGQYQDPHELAHANDIRHRFAADQNVTTGQIIMFGLTGGLIPCPASITVLLLCLQLKKIALGALLVLCFSIGLALTMVASGVIAALGAKHLSKRWSGFSNLTQKVPYFSSALIILIGIYFGYHGLMAIL